MIFITGDIHGEAERFTPESMPGEDKWTAEDYLIVCGDFGMLFRDNYEENEALDRLSEKPYTILFVDGNHENFHAINSYPTEIWNGGQIHRIRKNIIHLMRGQVFSIEGKSFFTFGGAYSVDRCIRWKNVSYWDEELPNNSEYNEGVKSLRDVGNRVDYILTHTAPREIIKKLGFYPVAEDMELTSYLEWVMNNIKYTKWFFGHFHKDKAVDSKHIALYYDVVSTEK